MIPEPTQVVHSWRTVTRTLFQALIAMAVLSPLLINAVNNKDTSTATGFAAGVLIVSGAITRVMAIPGVNQFIEKYLPFLAARPVD